MKDTFRPLAVSINGLEDLGEKFISNFLENTNESNYLDTPESSIFFEAHTLNGTVDENSTMTFPMANRSKSEQVSVPGSFLQGLMNTSNSSGVVPNITVSEICILYRRYVKEALPVSEYMHQTYLVTIKL